MKTGAAFFLRFWPTFFLAVFTALLLFPLLAGRTLFFGDISLYFLPMLEEARRSLLVGKIPLWNSYVFAGQPYLGNPQMGVFYPTTLLLYFFSAERCLALLTWLHLWLCGVFMTAFLHRLTSSRTAALCGGLVYCGSAFLVARIQFPPMLFTAVYLPLLLLLLHRYITAPTEGVCDSGLESLCRQPALRVQKRTRLLTSRCKHRRSEGGVPPGVREDASVRLNWFSGDFCLLALAFGLLLLAAHPQMAFLSLLILLPFAGRELFAVYGEERKKAFRLLIGLVCAGLLGLLLASVQILPGLQLVMESPREKMTLAEADRFVMAPGNLLTSLLPRFLGHPATGDFWGEGNAWEPALFVGWLPLGLSVWILWSRERRKRLRFWGLLVGAGLWLACGATGWLYQAAFILVPGVAKFHDPARFLFFITVGIAVLTAFGAQKWFERKPGRVSAGLLLVGIALPLLWYGVDWNPTTQTNSLPLASQEGRSVFPSGEGRIYLPDHVIYWGRFVNYTDYGATDARTLRTFTNSFLPNLPMRFPQAAAHGYEPVSVVAPGELDEATRAARFHNEPNFSRLVALFHVDRLLSRGEHIVPDPRFAAAGRNSLWTRFYRNRDYLPAAWVVRKVRMIASADRAIAAVCAPDFLPEQEAIVSGFPVGQGNVFAALLWGETQGRGKPVGVAVQAANSTRVELQADAGNSPGFLVYSAAVYPGWRASLDGVPVPLFRADAALQGIYLPAGSHTVLLEYRPDVYRLGLYFSLLTVSIVCGVAAFSRWTFSHKPQREKEIPEREKEIPGGTVK